jgi:hypothetical protein
MARLLILFLLGGLAGWCLAPSPRGREEVATVPPSTAPRSPNTGPRRELPRSPEDFARWIAERAAAYQPGSGPADSFHTKELENWTPEELRASLAEGLGDPGLLREGPARRAMLALLGEWTKRDPDAAWAWLSGLPAGPVRSRLGGAIAEQWPLARAEEGLELVIADVENFKVWGVSFYVGLLHKAVESAAKRGPLAADELISRAYKSGLQSPGTGLVFPPGFDFAGFIRAPFTAGTLSHQGIPSSYATEAWLRADADAAIPGIVALDRQQGRAPGFHLFNSMRHANEEQSRKVGVALGKLPPERQREILTSGGMNVFLGETPVLRAFVEVLPDPSLRAEASLAAAGRLFRRDLGEALKFIDAGSDPAERVANLEAQMAAPAGTPRYSSDSSLDSSAEKQLRETLASWNASPEQVERIVEGLKRIKN